MALQNPFLLLLLQDNIMVSSILIFFITFFVFRLILNKSHYYNRRLPPGPRGWPIVGALPLLGDMPHVALAKMAKKYGPVMLLKMGSHHMVVASNPDSARAFLKTLDQNFANRPVHAGPTLLSYNSQDMVFLDYGPKWKLMRKLSNVHMLGGKAIDDFSEARAEELGHMIHAMYQSSKVGEAVVVPDMLTYTMANVLGLVILSRRVFETKGAEVNEFKDMVVELMTTAGYFNIGDFIPSIAWMDLQGIERGMKILHKKFDILLSKMVQDHIASKSTRKGKPDFLDTLLEIYQHETMDGAKLSLINIKALLMNLFAAGVDTSSSIIEWSLAEMLKNPSIMKRAQDEMDRVIGRDRRFKESDVPNLPYFQAICKEAYRLHPSTPLNLPRIAAEACVVDGYYIPKNTRLSVNIWAIGRDPQVWDNPLKFNPDRFLEEKNAKIDPRGNDFELIPFGAGRRICAGTRMGIVMVHYILGTLLHSFDWKLPKDVTELNMEEVFGLALQKKVPLAAMVTPRLTPTVYVAPSKIIN